MTAKIIEGVRFRKIESAGQVSDMLHDILVDYSEHAESGVNVKDAELFAVVRYPDGEFVVAISTTTDLLNRLGALDVMKQYLIWLWGERGKG